MKRAPSTATLAQTDNVDRFVGVAYENVTLVAAHLPVLNSIAENLIAILEFNAGTGSPSFETISKNLRAHDASFVWDGDELESVIYANGITKTLTYSLDGLASVTLSGAVPVGIDLTKTLIYLDGDLIDAVYS